MPECLLRALRRGLARGARARVASARDVHTSRGGWDDTPRRRVANGGNRRRRIVVTSREAARDVRRLSDEFTFYKNTVMSAVGAVTVELGKSAVNFDQAMEALRRGGEAGFGKAYGDITKQWNAINDTPQTFTTFKAAKLRSHELADCAPGKVIRIYELTAETVAAVDRELLARRPDSEIAREHGVSRCWVGERRKSLGIEP